MCDDPFQDFNAEVNLPCAADSTMADCGISRGDNFASKLSQWYVDPPPLLGNSDLPYGTGNFVGRAPYYSNDQGYQPAYLDDCGYFQAPFKPDGPCPSYEPTLASSPETYTSPLAVETNAVHPTLPCGVSMPITNNSNANGVVELLKAPRVGRSYCMVCGDTASGNHFGVLSCEACKSFFRRSIRANARYACRWTRTCAVDRFTRNRCKYCRLEKCALIGMKKEAVQEDRLIIGCSLMSKAQTQVEVCLPPPQFRTSVHRILSFMAQEAKPLHGISTDLVDSTSGDVATSLLKSGQDPDLQCTHFPITMATLLNIAVEPKSKDLKPMIGSVRVKDVIDTLQQVCFTKVVRWSAQIPSFTHLGLDDQVRLLKASWCEQCILLFAMDNIVVPKTAFVLESYLCERDQIEDPTMTEIVDRVINNVTYWLDYLHVDQAELACLRALLLFNPGARSLSPTSRRAVELYQEQILAELGAYIINGHGVGSPRLAKLVLQLGSIKAISHEMLQTMVVQQKQGMVTMGDTFCELMQFD